jgi:hypothetical protein
MDSYSPIERREEAPVRGKDIFLYQNFDLQEMDSKGQNERVWELKK